VIYQALRVLAVFCIGAICMLVVVLA